jgi:hypothetical protein
LPQDAAGSALLSLRQRLVEHGRQFGPGERFLNIGDVVVEDPLVGDDEAAIMKLTECILVSLKTISLHRSVSA